ncbi:MAG: VCBS repeat-containing protein [Bacteroidetes bacterium]|nr:VCBS repeat-containing protein [Bacteroidota bacterium]
MKGGYKISICGLSVFLLIFYSCQTNTSENISDPATQSELQLFSLLNADATGLEFINIIIEDGVINFIDYDYMYNGSGVAIGDLNNDGLPEVYFAGNMTPNQLYLNKGNLKFENITQDAGVDGANGWCNGVTMADVNADGYLDIYVCRAYNDRRPDLRENLLYINNGDLTFTEMAKEYNLNCDGYSTQATFFDYDNDGDLDLFLGNHPREFHFTDIQTRIDQRNNPQLFESDRLYRNNGDNTFQDVTIEAGILNFGYSLGIVASDINNDGWIDIYVANDYEGADNLYMNHGDGTFSDQIATSVKHISNYGMGADLADINNDGLLDIVVLDMMAEDNYRQKTNMAAMDPARFWLLVDNDYHFQYMRNTLQLNNGNGSFSEVGQLAGINYTDWSWAALFADFDNDGYKDLFVSNGYRRDSRNKDFHSKLQEKLRETGGDMTTEDIIHYLGLMPSQKLPNYYFENNGDLTFSNKSIPYGFDEPSFSNGAAYADLDADGDLDIVVNNLTDQAFLYKNNSIGLLENNYLRIKLIGDESNPMGLGAKVKLTTESGTQYQELTLTRGYLSSIERIIHFGLGRDDRIDELSIEWPGGKTEKLYDLEINQLITLDAGNASNPIQAPVRDEHHLFMELSHRCGITFIHKENNFDDYKNQSLLPHKMSQFGPIITVGDVNYDGNQDFYVGGAAGESGALFIQNSYEHFTEHVDQPWQNDAANEDIGAIFFDADNDLDLDLYVVSGGNEFESTSNLLQDRLYVNDGAGNFTHNEELLPEMLTSGSCVIAADYDGDGDQDLFIGGRVVPGKYPLAPRSYILRNENGRFSDVTEEIAPELVNAGMVTSAIWTDFDGDGQTDLMVVGEWMPVSFYRNNNGNFENITQDLGFENSTGWWNKIVQGDFDQDGDMDYVVGNLGLNYKYKATEEEALHIYCHDFDRSGSLDIVLGYYNQGTCYPVRGRQCTSEQMPFILQKFSTYHEFGKATLQDVYGDDLEVALHYEAKYFASSYIENKGGKSFEITPLPVEAQFSTVFGIIPEDLDHDGFLDLLIAGNFYVSEVETGRADAGVGLFMKGNGKGQFTPVRITDSGFNASKDVRDLALLKRKATLGSLILVGNNNDAMQVFRVKPLFEEEELAFK